MTPASRDHRVAFLIAGVQKAGTTALFDYLSAHPEVDMPAIKEARFFDDDRLSWATPDYRPYHALFAGSATALRGEATPIYVYWPRCLERIAAYNPAMRWILLFRDPVERAWSHWRMETARGVEKHPFAWCIREGRARVAGHAASPGVHREFSYVERGFYGAQIQRVFQAFPRRQVLALPSRELASEPTATLRRVTDFLGVAPFRGEIRPIRSRVGRQMGDGPTRADVDLLRSLYAADHELFTRLTGFGFSGPAALAPHPPRSP